MAGSRLPSHRGDSSPGSTPIKRNTSFRRLAAQIGNRMLPPISRQTYFHLAVLACLLLTVVGSFFYVSPGNAALDGSRHTFAPGTGPGSSSNEARRDLPPRPVAEKAAQANNEAHLKKQPIWLYPASDLDDQSADTMSHTGGKKLQQVTEAKTGRMEVRNNKVPGQGWKIDPLPKGAFRSSVRRVAMISEACLPKIDGVSKTTYLVAQHHLNQGREVLLLCPATDLYNYREGNPVLLPKRSVPAGPGEPEGSVRVVGVTSVHFPRFPYETRLGLPAYKVDELEAFKPDIVQLFSPAFLGWTGITYKSRHPEVPLIANFQTDIASMSGEFGYGAVESIVWWLLKQLHNTADLTLTPSHFMIRRLRGRGFNNQRLWIRGIDHEKYSPKQYSNETRKLMLNGRPESTLIAVYVGRLSEEKHCEFLLDTAHLEGVQLVIVGDGPTRGKLENMMAGTGTLFLGMVIGSELPRIYASADLFVFTGTAETAGNVVREAMASGTPVLLPNSGGVVDTVLDKMNGFLCEPDSRSFASKVKKIRDDRPLLEDMRQRTITYSKLIPAWTEVMENLEKFYQEAVDSVGGRDSLLVDDPGAEAGHRRAGHEHGLAG